MIIANVLRANAAAPAPATPSASAWSQLTQRSQTGGSAPADDAAATSPTIALLKKQAEAIKKMIEAQQEQLRQMMADSSLSEEQRRTQARALQQSIATLQGSLAQVYQSIQKALEQEQGTSSGSQLDAMA